ncbi:hypothetical protein LTR42_009064 [Elasticomyces elasticus]|nr:hypothetical protein LTR42_009064 [Elasticomyces elasticus]
MDSNTSHISRLPLELLIKIIVHLPTNEIIGIKAVNRKLYHTVTASNSDAALFRDHAQSALRRLTNIPVLRIMKHPSPFVQSLANFLTHRGIQANRTLRIRDVHAFVTLWQEACYQLPDADEVKRRPSHAELCAYAYVLIDIHVFYHGGTAAEYQYDDYGTTVRKADIAALLNISKRMPWFALPLYNDGSAKVTKAFRTIRKVGLLDEDGNTPDIRYDQGTPRPEWPITARIITGVAEFDAELYDNPCRRIRERGICSVDRLGAMLDDSLPSFLGISHAIAYCVSTREAYYDVWILTGGRRRELSWKVKALLLEQMYVY